MVTRLPTHLDTLAFTSFEPSGPSEPASLLKPWRGIFLVSGTRASDISSNVEIRVTGVETSGDIKSHIWPSRIIFSITAPHALPVLFQLKEYIKTRSPPIPVATFLPERLRDPDQNVVNQTHFRSLSRLLWDSQLVAIASLDPPDSLASPPFSYSPQRHGMLIFPAENSTALLIGAIFLEDAFPDFVLPTQASMSMSPYGFDTYTSSGQGSSVPISPTVIDHQRRRASAQSYPSLRTASVHSSHRYNPIAVGGRAITASPQEQHSFSQPPIPTAASMPSQTMPTHFSHDFSPNNLHPGYIPPNNFLPDNVTPGTHPPASSSYSTQSNSPLEHRSAYSQLHGPDTFGHSSSSRHSE
ncbi:hypothetical protein BT96DRAFT_464668 [Gymnopus androsaceus JB14]|uniref:Uncharacterized protein n=1 Tax=Gymnopus androsaceus JB14 TaxID=1447944 RepID=A0A6A4IHD5_9AGAR|nr:hypothetical protein BT96DRAFT_464668 [Gymnopus androsaceus JB14]